MDLRCHVHEQPLQRVERTPPRLGRRPDYVEYAPSEEFSAPERVIFPHARPLDLWVATYYFCPRCEEARREWKQRTRLEAEAAARRETQAVAPRPKRRSGNE